MRSSVETRLMIAARIATELREDPSVAEVWLEGALGAGLAHARSDVDLRVVFSDQPTVLRSRVMDGVRVDLARSAYAAVDSLREMLRVFEVHFDDVERFRQIRGALDQLTRFRTAQRRTSEGWQPVATVDEIACYRRWAVADRVERVLSLVEDLLGLAADRLYTEAEVVLSQLELCLLGLDCAAAGQPLLGDKWLPALWRRVSDAPPPSLPAPAWGTDDASWFSATRARVTAALLHCWPDDDTDSQAPPSESTQVGWLPQRYTDGWFLRCGDERIRLTPGQLRGWHRAVSGRE